MDRRMALNIRQSAVLDERLTGRKIHERSVQQVSHPVNPIGNGDKSGLEDSTHSGLVSALMRKPLLILALAGEVLFGGGLQAQDAPAVSPWKVEALSKEGQIQYKKCFSRGYVVYFFMFV